MTIKLLALAASYRNDSLNRTLLEAAIPLAEAAGAAVTTLDYAALESPAYRGAHDALPVGARTFADALLEADGLLLASPEYNWSIPGSLKNLIDWLSVDDRKPITGRTAFLMCATPGVRGGFSGLQHLRVPLEKLGMWVYPQMVGIGGGILSKPRDKQFLETSVQDFVRSTKALRDA